MEIDTPEWVLQLRELFQEVYSHAVETHAYLPASFHSNLSLSTDTQQGLRLVPLTLIKRLRHIYRRDVHENNGKVIEDQWIIFLNEVWKAIGRILLVPLTNVSTKCHGTITMAFAIFFGTFLRADELKDQDKMTEASVDEFRQEILLRIMKATNTEDKTTRTRACQFLQLILNTFTYIEDSLYTKILSLMLPRANDKVALIRTHSIYCLKKLQNPDDPNDRVTIELVRMMGSDVSKDVRCAALECLALTPRTYQDFLTRIRDANEVVRSTAFRVFASQMPLKKIPINDRTYLLDQGLRDRFDIVRTACEDMVILKWLPSCENSPVKLLKSLDIEQFSEVSSDLAKLIIRRVVTKDPFYEPPPYDVLKALKTDPKRKIQELSNETQEEGNNMAMVDTDTEDAEDYYHVASLDREEIFYWREQIEYFQKIEHDEDKLTNLLPNLTDFCTVLVAVCQHRQSIDLDESNESMVFLGLQLLALGQHLDFQDEIGRRNLLLNLQQLLSVLTTDRELIHGIMELIACVYAPSGSEQEFVQAICEILSDLYDPLEEEQNEEDSQIPSVGTENQPPTLTQDELEAATKRYDELDAQLDSLHIDSNEYKEVQRELLVLEAKLQDPQLLRWLRCLQIVAEMLKVTTLGENNSYIAGLARYIFPAIESDVSTVRELGLECLGLYCLLDRNIAERHLIVFWRALHHPDEEKEVRLCCVRAIIDMNFRYAGLQPRQPVNQQRTTTDDESVAQESKSEEPSGIVMESLPLQEVFSGLADLMVAPGDLKLQAIIVEGFAKLFLVNRLDSPAVLAKMLETYLSPTLQQVQLLPEYGYSSKSSQILSVFFPAFVQDCKNRPVPLKGQAIDDRKLHCMLLERAFIFLFQDLDSLSKEVKLMPMETETADSDEKHNQSQGSAATEIDLLSGGKFVFHLLRHENAGVVNTEQEDSVKIEDGLDEKKKIISIENEVTADVHCSHGHHHNISLALCIDIIALEQVSCEIFESNMSNLELKRVAIGMTSLVERQKLLLKLLLLLDIEPLEYSAFQHLQVAVKELVEMLQNSAIENNEFNKLKSNSTALKKAMESLYKRLNTLASTNHIKIELTDDSAHVDKEQLNDRKAKILADVQKKMDHVMEAKANQAVEAAKKRQKNKKKRSRFTSSSEESSVDTEDDESYPSTNTEPPPKLREMSSRKSKSKAVDRIRGSGVKEKDEDGERDDSNENSLDEAEIIDSIVDDEEEEDEVEELTVVGIFGHRCSRGKWELKIRWQGLTEEDDSYEPLKNMMEDIPEITEEYVKKSNDKKLQQIVSKLKKLEFKSSE